jgi:hypothetical protein
MRKIRGNSVWMMALILTGLLAGCATSKIDWNARVGTYTFDQAVVELGPPDKQAKLTDGTLVAEWLTSRGRAQAHALYGYGDPRWHHGPLFNDYVVTQSPDYFLRLVFGPDGKLQTSKGFAR